MQMYRPAEDRGVADHGWLYSHHTFSFANYYDPRFMGFGPLRVINDDRVAPSGGFPTHPHRDMEIVSYVLDGQLKHKDTMGNETLINVDEVQRMSAGTGVYHSEYNASDDKPVHFLQIWIETEKNGIQPGYEQIAFKREDKVGQLKLVASRDGREGSVRIFQDVDLYGTILENGQSVTHTPRTGRLTWVHVATGGGTINGQDVKEGDGMAFESDAAIEIASDSQMEFLLFDMTPDY